MTGKTGKIAVAMSGGVDSSTTAALLLEQGHDIIGITMRLWRPDNTTTPEPAEDAARIAKLLGIPHHILDCREEFRRDVMAYFADEYRSGRTPNPCARCNRLIKFGRLLEAATSLGATRLATGHYARLHHAADGTTHLFTGKDQAKDQSYFLFDLTQHQLGKLLFPLGEMTKQEVRAHAARLQLPVAEKGESQDVCFIPDGDYVRFLETEGGIVPRPGAFVLADGRRIGDHQGIHRYTIGQRRGMGIAWSEPLFVVGIDATQDQVQVGTRAELAASGLIATRVNWLVPQSGPVAADCKIRYRHRAVPCQITPMAEGTIAVRFSEQQHGVTPGQAVVFYRGEEVLGGGWIESSQ
jgi:tRNA-specific 2-thiouridylase